MARTHLPDRRFDDYSSIELNWENSVPSLFGIGRGMKEFEGTYGLAAFTTTGLTGTVLLDIGKSLIVRSLQAFHKSEIVLM